MMKITLQWVPHDQWPRLTPDTKRFNVWQSYSYMVQAFHEKNGVVRLAVKRNIKNTERTSDSICWDELQAIKAACGYGNFEAVEVFPTSDDEQPAGGMRHLWIMPKSERLEFAWRNASHQLSLIRDMLSNKPDEEKGS